MAATPNYMTTATKRKIAVTQLRRAILLYQEGDFICSITLAGAAEEILGRMAAQRGHPTALDDFAKRDRKLWEWAAAKESRLTVPGDAELRRRLNRVRNEAKHNDSGRDKRVKAIYDYEADEMLTRCMFNYLTLYGKPPRDKVISEWWDYVRWF
jgi:hypothetical protein